MQMYKTWSDLFQQFVITCPQTVTDTTELCTSDMLNPSFDFSQRLPCHAYALELEHPDKFCLPDPLFFTDMPDIAAYINPGLFDFLFHTIAFRKKGLK